MDHAMLTYNNIILLSNDIMANVDLIVINRARTLLH